MAAILSLACVPALAADVISVGTDGPCDFDNLQDAIDAAWDGAFIRVQQGWHGQNLRFRMHDKSLVVSGGYEKCWGPQTGETTLYVKDDTRVLSIRSLDKRSRVELSRLTISGAEPGDPTERLAGGVEIRGDVDVEMDQVEVRYARGVQGGGIDVSSIQVGLSERRPTLTLLESRLYQNRGTNLGGGLACHQADLAVGRVLVEWNEAPSGGGIGLFECTLSVDGEVGALTLQKNHAERAGAGMLLSRSEMEVTPGKDGRAGLVAVGNHSDGDAGAISVAAESRLEASGFRFESNVALGSGGALSVWNSTLVLGRDLEACWLRQGCQTFEGNIAGMRGGVLYLREADVRLELVRAHNNLAFRDGGAFATLWFDSKLRLVNTVLSENRGKTLIDADRSRDLTVISSTFFSNRLSEAMLWIPELRRALVSQSILVDDEVSYVAGGVATMLCSLVHGPAPLPGGAVGSLWIDPIFAADGDFHLDFDSPAAEMCDDTTPHGEIDFDLEVRPSRGRFEPGADELD